MAGLVWTVLGCVRKEPLPLSEDRLVPLLADMHAAETALMSYDQKDKDSIGAMYYRQLVSLHGVEREVLDTCIAILRRHPDQMAVLYDQVLRYLEQREPVGRREDVPAGGRRAR